MNTLFDSALRDALRGRLARLRPDSTARWGRMNAHQMLCHVGDQLRVALGELSAPRNEIFLRFRVFRQVFVHWLPWPKGKVPTDPVMLTTKPEEWEADVAALGALFDRFAERSPDEQWAPHPAFGRLSGREWGQLAAKHLDYHLKQFGV